MRDALEARELLEQLGLVRGPQPEVGGYGVADSGGIPAQHAREARQALAALGRRGVGIDGERATLKLERLRELRRSGREARRFLCRGHRG